MILDEITLHDFGVYGGRQKIELTPISQEQPIILFGGLNGGGKTTLLDALQLCFFGNMAKCAGRGDLTYDEYLRRSVHHRALAPEASVEVAFRHMVDGEMQRWRLTRSWSAGDHVRERFQVIRNDQLDKTASEQWNAQVEDFIPARIAHLFLFDGEKVEGYADLDQAPGLIRTAIQNLLGLDVVERLQADLTAIERRKKAERKTPQESEVLAQLRDQIRDRVSQRSGAIVAKASAQNDLDRLSRKLNELEERYEREGGALFDDRGRIEAELAVAQRGQDAIRRSLRELAGGAAPLALVRDLLQKVATRHETEEAARRSRHTATILADEHALLLNLPALSSLSSDARRALEAFSTQRLESLNAEAGVPRHLNLDESTGQLLSSLLNSGVEDAVTNARASLKQNASLVEAVEHYKSLMGAVPGHEAVADLIAQREMARDAVKRAQYEYERYTLDVARLDRELEALRDREIRLLETTVREQFEQEDTDRLLMHSAKVRTTLATFREAVVQRHVARIEAYVLESFQQIIRKSSLVTGLRIDPVSFQVELTGADKRQLTAERLSAGERQLLAIALLWGLAKASGRPLPTVIDTPLGRLDSEHRSRLVSKYFPKASHQVMLLSTDEEITRTYYNTLAPSIGRSYRLRYDEVEGRTVVEPGYFPTEGNA